MHNFVSWADVERDLSAWLGNTMQKSAIKELYNMEQKVKESNDEQLLEDWRKLTTSDHYYYMCTKWFNDGDVHKYFNPYDSPYEAFIAFMNILNDMSKRINDQNQEQAFEADKVNVNGESIPINSNDSCFKPANIMVETPSESILK